jgi:hypothetical protein
MAAYRQICSKVTAGEFFVGGRHYPAVVARKIGSSLIPGDVYAAVRRREVKAPRHATRLHMWQVGKNLLTRFDRLQQHQCAGDDWAEDFPDSMRKRICSVQNRDMKKLPRTSDLGDGAVPYAQCRWVDLREL